MVCFTKATWLDSEPEADGACAEKLKSVGVWWSLVLPNSPLHKLFHPLTFWQISGCSLPSCVWWGNGRRGAGGHQRCSNVSWYLSEMLISVAFFLHVCVPYCYHLPLTSPSLVLPISLSLTPFVSVSVALVFVFSCRSSFTLLIFRSFFASPVRLDVVIVIPVVAVVVVVVVVPWGGRHLSHFVCV